MSYTQRVFAPWSEKQVKCLNEYQKSPFMHAYTCGRGGRGDTCGEIVAYIDNDPESPIFKRSELVATKDGWKCFKCGYTQNWASYAATVFNEEEYLKANQDICKFIQRTHFMVDDFLVK